MSVPVPSPLSDGSLLLTPGLFEVQLGVIAWPLSIFVTPEICQLLNSCFSTGASKKDGMS